MFPGNIENNVGNMRLLIMVHNLTGGGAEHVASLWATGFVQCGYDVGVVLNCKKKTPITYPVPNSVKFYNISGNDKILRLAGLVHRYLHIDFYFVYKLKLVLRDFHPDVAVGVLQPWAEWTRKASKGMNIKIINTEHNSFERPDTAPMSKRIKKQKYVFNHRYKHVTVLTEADKRCVDGLLSNVSVLPNPLAFLPADKMPIKENVILAAGRLDAWYVKGFDVLIKAWGNIAKDYPAWKLQIAGDSRKGGKEKMQVLAKEIGIENQLEFLGFNTDMRSLYQHSSVFVLSSRFEGFGMVLIEAMSQGCAPIACDYKGRQREIIRTDAEGIICPVDDVESLAKAIVRMIEDSNYRYQTQLNAIKRSKYYCLDNVMDKWDKILNNISL